MLRFSDVGSGSDYQAAKTPDVVQFGRYLHAMLEWDVYKAPPRFEAGFMSLVHSQDDIEKTVETAEAALQVTKWDADV